MEVKDLKLGDYITFKYGDSPYFHHVTGKIISLDIPKSLKNRSAENLDWKAKLNLKGHVTLLPVDGEEMTLCLAQVINGCEYATSFDKRNYQKRARHSVSELTKKIEKLKKKFEL